MAVGDFFLRSDCCRVNPVRNTVVLDAGYARVHVHCEERVCDVVVFSGSILNGAVKGHEKVLSSPELLAVCCSLYEGEQEFVIRQDYTFVIS